MRTLAILPIKSFGAAKQRLAGLLGTGSLAALSQAMFSDVLSSLRRVRSVESIAVVTAADAAQSAARGRQVVVLPDSEEAGQSAAALVGIRHAVAAGFERVLLVPGDTPLIDPRELDALLERDEERSPHLTIVPDRHGSGTNALVIAPPDAFKPRFGPGSLARHEAAARASGMPHRIQAVPSLARDVDTPEDLADLAAVLDERRGLAPMTRGALRQLDRSSVRAPVGGESPLVAEPTGVS